MVFMACGVLFTACKNDDDDIELPQNDQNQVDDEAIIQYLQDHYFEPNRGLIKAYNESDSTDDVYPSLQENATQLPSGVWIVKRQGVTAEGPVADDNTQDSILISLETKVFKADNRDLLEGERLYGTLSSLSSEPWSTINQSGQPIWDPFFYYTHLTDAQIENDINLSNFVIEGFTEGIKHFNSTETDGLDVYNFQGAIIVPSRAAYGRDVDYISGTPKYNYRDFSFVFNFELHKVIDRIP